MTSLVLTRAGINGRFILIVFCLVKLRLMDVLLTSDCDHHHHPWAACLLDRWGKTAVLFLFFSLYLGIGVRGFGGEGSRVSLDTLIPLSPIIYMDTWRRVNSALLSFMRRHVSASYRSALMMPHTSSQLLLCVVCITVCRMFSVSLKHLLGCNTPPLCFTQ